MRFDILVLGSGIVGTALALDLALRGRSVGLVDRRTPGAETSFGNAGLIQSEAIMPYPFPRDPLLLLQYALNLKPEANYHLADVLSVAPFLWRYFRASSREGQLKTAAANAPLFRACLDEHSRLAQAAGAESMLRRGGWIKAFRSKENMEGYLEQTKRDLAHFDIAYDVLDRAALQAREPHLSDVAVGAVHWTTPYSLNDPEALTLAYARKFEALGGKLVNGNALTLTEDRDGWSVEAEGQRVSAPDCVVALGPWAPDLLRPMGYAVPMGVKRGYHVHMRPKGNASLGVPVLDADVGYMLVPMVRGIRLTSGAEFAARDSTPTPIQIDKIEPFARELMPLEGRVETTPWMGARPCMPDMLAVIGKAPRHKGLWFNFGHAHHGLTLAGSSARLLGEMITGETPYTDPTPYSLARFN
jgi:D-amino-acid dehydrogenase